MADIKVYGAMWCGDCRRSKKFLDKNNVAYLWLDVEEDPSLIPEVSERNAGMHSLPTIVFPDGSHITEPSDAELAEKLAEFGVSTKL